VGSRRPGCPGRADHADQAEADRASSPNTARGDAISRSRVAASIGPAWRAPPGSHARDELAERIVERGERRHGARHRICATGAHRPRHPLGRGEHGAIAAIGCERRDHT
jgi:tRNA(Ile2) C34 agmatinyltransferase TiaS